MHEEQRVYRLRVLEYYGTRHWLTSTYARNAIPRTGPRCIREYRPERVSFSTRLWLAWRILVGRDY